MSLSFQKFYNYIIFLRKWIFEEPTFERGGKKMTKKPIYLLEFNFGISPDEHITTGTGSISHSIMVEQKNNNNCN